MPGANQVTLVTDTVSDLPDHVAEGLGVILIPMIVRFGDQEFRDRVDLDTQAVLDRLAATREPARTSQPSPGEFMDAFRRAARDGATVVSVQPSMKFSGAYQTACLARDLLAEEGYRVEVVDSNLASMAQGWAVIEGARAARAGQSVDQVLDRIRHVCQRARTYLTLDTLHYLQRNGRLGRIQALLGSLLQLRPILTLRDGEFAIADAAVGAGQVMSRLVLTIRRNVREGARVALAVVHASAQDRAEHLLAELGKFYEVVESIVTETGAGIAANVGPGGFGAMLYEVD